MRILHILDHSVPTQSGYAFRTNNILREQHALGWETFQVTSPKHGDLGVAEETVDGLHFYRTRNCRMPGSAPSFVRELALMFALIKRLQQLAVDVRPDILHAHSPVLNAFPALYVGQQMGIPVVYELRSFWEDAAVDLGKIAAGGLRYRVTRGLETLALKRAAAVTTICEGLKRDIASRGVSEDKVTVIPNSVDIGDFSLGGAPDPALKARLGLQGATVIGFIGSFFSWEGLDVLLTALPLMLRAKPGIRILLIGGGPQEQALKDLARQLRILDKIVFLGRIHHSEIQRYYDLVDVCCYPRHSLRLTELVTPLKPLEAMAQGRMIVASNVGGHRELIDDGVTGMLCRPDDPAALARKVLDLLDHPHLWPALQARARAFVEDERTWKRSVAHYRDVYLPLLTRSR
jgi:PEP-CTERM/exosortase A-associated glycosyltransferase